MGEMVMEIEMNDIFSTFLTKKRKEESLQVSPKDPTFFEKNKKPIYFCGICWFLLLSIYTILFFMVLFPTFIEFSVNSADTHIISVYLMYPENGGKFQYQLTMESPPSAQMAAYLDVSVVLRDMEVSWDGTQLFTFAPSSRINVAPGPMSVHLFGQVVNLAAVKRFEKNIVYSSSFVPVDVQGNLDIIVGKFFNEPIFSPLQKSDSVHGTSNFSYPFPTVINNCTHCASKYSNDICLSINATGNNLSQFGTIFGQGMNATMWYSDAQIGYAIFREIDVTVGKFPIKAEIVIWKDPPTLRQKEAVLKFALTYEKGAPFNVTLEHFEFLENPVDWLEELLSLIRINLHIHPNSCDVTLNATTIGPTPTPTVLPPRPTEPIRNPSSASPSTAAVTLTPSSPVNAATPKAVNISTNSIY